MDKLIIHGPSKLSGTVKVSSSKNASLPILIASILTEKTIRFTNLPKLQDVKTLFKLLSELGAEIQELNTNETQISCKNIHSYTANYELVKTMRASFLVLGPLVARFGEAKVSLPGGCSIGTRAVDIHLEGLAKLGMDVELKGGYVYGKLKNNDSFKGNEIYLPFPSVGATEHILMTSSLAKGVTIIKNAAREPEIEDLGNFLKTLGVKIEGLGTNNITIYGQDKTPLASTSNNQFLYEIIPDRIEAATLIIAAIITNSSITINNVYTKHLEILFTILKEMGANFVIDEKNNQVKVLNYDSPLKGVNVATEPYPGFPTDIQAQLLSLSLIAHSPSIITEHIFENRFMHIPELNRLGANIQQRGNSAYIEGCNHLVGAPVMCTDLRASAALILAALIAKGTSEITRIYHLDRGYEALDSKLKGLNVNITRVSS